MLPLAIDETRDLPRTTREEELAYLGSRLDILKHINANQGMPETLRTGCDHRTAMGACVARNMMHKSGQVRQMCLGAAYAATIDDEDLLDEMRSIARTMEAPQWSLTSHQTDVLEHATRHLPVQQDATLDSLQEECLRRQCGDAGCDGVQEQSAHGTLDTGAVAQQCLAEATRNLRSMKETLRQGCQALDVPPAIWAHVSNVPAAVPKMLV